MIINTLKQRGSVYFPFLLVFFEIVHYLANDMYLPALPVVGRDLHISDHLAQQTMTAFFLGVASLPLLLGPLSDRWGRRPVLLGGGIIFVMSTLLCAVTHRIDVLILARFFQGCSICSIGTAGYSSIHEIYQKTKAIKILALMNSITILAPAFGPLLGGFLLLWVSWRWIFGLLFIAGMIAFSLLCIAMPESHPAEKRHPLEWKTVFKNTVSIVSNKQFMVNIMMICCNFLALIAWIAAGPFLVMTYFKMTTLSFGIFQALIFGCLILGSQVVKYKIDAWGVERMCETGLCLNGVAGSLAFISTLLFPHFLVGLIGCLMVFAFGSSLVFAPANRRAIEACTEPMGARMAIFSMLTGFFASLAGLLVSLTFNGTLVWFGILLLSASIGAGLSGCWLRAGQPLIRSQKLQSLSSIKG